MPTNLPAGPTFSPQYTEDISIGDAHLTGGTSLTILLEGLMRQTPPDLEDLFPTFYTAERTISFEQYSETVTTMPLVEMGKIFTGQLSTSKRGRKRYATPAFLRENISIEDSAVNDVRRMGTYNERMTPAEIIGSKVEAMYMRRSETIRMLRYMALSGGISYVDARTDVSINVPSRIPPHNLFSYNGWGGTYSDGSAVANVPAGGVIPSVSDGNQYEAFGNLVVGKGRQEAFLFQDIQGRIGVPWTNKQCDIGACLAKLTTWLSEVNKIDGWEVYMSSALYNAIHQNDVIRASSGQIAVVGNMGALGGPRTGLEQLMPLPNSNVYTFNNGKLSAIAGIPIKVVQGRYTNPQTGEPTTYWPIHQVALVAPRSNTNPNDTIGMTYHCMGEYKDVIGPWLRTVTDPAPPALPGTTMQMGDALLPIIKYPHWLAIITVCEPNALRSGLYDDNQFTYGIQYSNF